MGDFFQKEENQNGLKIAEAVQEQFKKHVSAIQEDITNKKGFFDKGVYRQALGQEIQKVEDNLQVLREWGLDKLNNAEKAFKLFNDKTKILYENEIAK